MNINRMEAEILSEKLEELKLKLSRTISQMQLIDNRMRDLLQRMRRAATNKKHSFRYNLKMRATIAGGLKIVYTDYVTKKADEVAMMEQALEALRQRQQAEAVEQAEAREEAEGEAAQQEH